MSDIKKYLEILNEDGPGAKWRQGVRASGHAPGQKHSLGVGPVGGTFDTVNDYGDERKVPVDKYRDYDDPLAKRDQTKLSTKGTPLQPKNAANNLKGAIKGSLGKHGPVGTLPEGDDGISKDEETEFHTELDKLVHNTFGKRADEARDPDEAYDRYCQEKVDNTMPDGRSEWEHMGHGWAHPDYDRKTLQKLSDIENRVDEENGFGSGGMSADELVGAISYRIQRQRLDLIKTYGLDAVMDAVDQVASFHEGIDELGSSDVSAMVNDVERQLGAGPVDDDYTDRAMRKGEMGDYSVEEDAADPKNLDMTNLDFGDMDKEPLDFTEAMKREWENYIVEAMGKSPNRELWDQVRSKGVVPSINRERYTDMSGEGLEGPFRQKNGQVLYYDPRQGQYYNRDTDMYVDQSDFAAMNEEQIGELSHEALSKYVDRLDPDRINSDPASRQGFGRALNKMHSPEHVKIPAYRTRKEDDIESDFISEGDPDIPMDVHLKMKERESRQFRDKMARSESDRICSRADQAAQDFTKRQPVEEYGAVNPQSSQPMGSNPQTPEQLSQDTQNQQKQPMGSTNNANQQTDDTLAKFGKAMQDPSVANQMKQLLQKISL